MLKLKLIADEHTVKVNDLQSLFATADNMRIGDFS